MKLETVNKNTTQNTNTIYINNIDFGDNELLNRELVINMLKWESEFMCSPEGQARYKTDGSGQFTSLTNEYAFNRMVLRIFGFNTNANSVENYRLIFKTYFRSATDYDSEVINSSHYMRNNRCIFYTAPEINIGDQIPNVPLFASHNTKHNTPDLGTPDLNTNDMTTLYDAIKNYSLPMSKLKNSGLNGVECAKINTMEWNKMFICAFSNS